MRRTAGERGFTLMEVMMAFSILGAAASVMVAPLYRYGHRMDGVALIQIRSGIVAQQVGHLGVLPFDSLDARAGCTVVTSGPMAHTRCLTVTLVNASQKHLRLIVTPTSTLLAPDTVNFDRTKARSSNPFALP